jgi:hypothetical protein
MKRILVLAVVVLIGSGFLLEAVKYGTPDKRNWLSISHSTNGADYASFLSRFPNSEFAVDAHNHLKSAVLAALDTSFELMENRSYVGAKAVLEPLIPPVVTNALVINNYAVILAHQDRSDGSLQNALRLLTAAQSVSEKQIVPNFGLRVNTVLIQYWNTPSLSLSAFLSSDSPLRDKTASAAKTLSRKIEETGGKVFVTREETLLLPATGDWGTHSTVEIEGREYLMLSDEIGNNIVKVNLLLQHPNRESE